MFVNSQATLFIITKMEGRSLYYYSGSGRWSLAEADAYPYVETQANAIHRLLVQAGEPCIIQPKYR